MVRLGLGDLELSSKFIVFRAVQGVEFCDFLRIALEGRILFKECIDELG